MVIFYGTVEWIDKWVVWVAKEEAKGFGGDGYVGTVVGDGAVGLGGMGARLIFFWLGRS